MRRIVLSVTLIVLLLSSAGCETINRGREEINKIMFIRAVAVDKSYETEEKVKITVSSKAPQAAGGGGGGNGGQTSSQKKVADIKSAEGKTIFEAMRKLYSFSSKRPFAGQMSYLLIGEQAAKDGILKYLDFFIRDHEVPLSVNVIIVKGKDAEDVIIEGNAPEEFISDRLKSLFSTLDGLSFSDNINLAYIMEMLDTPQMSAYIPCIQLGGSTEMKAKDMNKTVLELNGFAVFKDDKLTGYITNEKARGLNWIHAKIISGTYIVKGNKGEDVTLEIIDSSSKIIPEFSNDKLSILIKISMTSNIAEITEVDFLNNQSSVKFLKSQQEALIKSEVESAIAFAQKNNVDILRVGDAVFHKHPVKWDKIKDNWKTVFPKLDISVEVKSTINRTYLIREPIGARIGEE